MKKLLLLILLTVSTYANNSKIPEKICPKHFNKIIEHGWSDENATLNAFIIRSGSRAIPKILTNLRTPLSFQEDPINPNYPIPKLLIDGDKYRKLFAYVKYLEHENRMEEVQKIYTDALYGLRNIESKENISLILSIVFERILKKSIKESHDRYGLNQELKNKLKKSLLLNDDYLFEVLNNDHRILLTYMNEFPELKKLSNAQHQLFMEAVKNNSLDEYNENSAKKQEKYLSFSNIVKYGYIQGKVKLYNFLGIELDKSFSKEFLITIFIYEPRIYIGKTIKDYQNQVKNNKIFLENLEESF